MAVVSDLWLQFLFVFVGVFFIRCGCVLLVVLLFYYLQLCVPVCGGNLHFKAVVDRADVVTELAMG